MSGGSPYRFAASVTYHGAMRVRIKITQLCGAATRRGGFNRRSRGHQDTVPHGGVARGETLKGVGPGALASPTANETQSIPADRDHVDPASTSTYSDVDSPDGTGELTITSFGEMSSSTLTLRTNLQGRLTCGHTRNSTSMTRRRCTIDSTTMSRAQTLRHRRTPMSTSLIDRRRAAT